MHDRLVFVRPKTNKTSEVLNLNDFGRYSCGGRIFKMLANADKIGGCET